MLPSPLLVLPPLLPRAPLTPAAQPAAQPHSAAAAAAAAVPAAALLPPAAALLPPAAAAAASRPRTPRGGCRGTGRTWQSAGSQTAPSPPPGSAAACLQATSERRQERGQRQGRCVGRCVKQGRVAEAGQLRSCVGAAHVLQVLQHRVGTAGRAQGQLGPGRAHRGGGTEIRCRLE